MIINGTIEEIIFRNDDNGYTVAVLSHKDNGFDEYTTIVGILPDARVGQCLKLEGKIINSKYGKQFSFTNAEIVYPSSISGIKKYLSSGLIKGIGPVTAGLIVDEFKNDTLTIIEYSPDKLAKIKGISKNKALQISQAYNDIKKMQNSVMFLQEYNISTNMAIKIFNTYGDKTIEYVKTNPYKLVEDIKGIGFLTADTIAKNMGIASNSMFRIRAGIVHCLEENCEKNGNTFLYKDMLLKDSAMLLGLNLEANQEKIEEALVNMGFDKLISMFRNKQGREIVMLTQYYFVESAIAQKLAKLNLTAKTTNKDFSKPINIFEQLNKICFDEQQKSAIENSLKAGVSVITGGPGTGKTTIVKCILNILEQEGEKVILLAPTGRASKRLSESTGRTAKTIHRGLEINFKDEKSTFVHNERNPLEANAVIVDEVSMVDAHLMNSLLKALASDCKLILVGDKDQLPSVGAGNVLSDILASKIIQVSYLTKIFRQDEKSLIVSNAHLINNGEMPIIDNTSNDFFFESQQEPIDIKNSIIGLITKRLPTFTKLEPSKIQVLAPLKAGASGVESLNNSLQEIINPLSPGRREIHIGKTILREGDKVMQTSNNYDLTWTRKIGLLTEEGSGVFNGDIGYVDRIFPGSDEIIVLFEDGRVCTYQKPDAEDLTLAYAITIHKSQGSEFDVVVIPIIAGPSIILTRNLIYTAITRAKKLVVLVGSKKNLARMVTNKYTAERLTMLKDFLIESNEKLKLLYDN
ncbi:MAG: ATP-dependent RecD-like DNA helicase [Clostridiales bacterium]|nr:ATP-dependent RecD-like DNA helicase [Clostridiales bacterium]